MRPVRMAAAMLLALASTAGAVEAQQVDPDRLVQLTVELPSQVMSATVREGSALRLVLHDTAEVELVPVVARGGGDRVLMAVYRGTVDKPETRRLHQRVELTVGVPARLRGEPRIGVVVDALRETPAIPPLSNGINTEVTEVDGEVTEETA